MHYLKCNLCDRLVEMKSEYMTFCPACKRKLGNSFTVWSESHPGASFQDYLGEVCVSDNAIQGVREQRRIGRTIGRLKATKRAGWALIIALTLAIVGSGGYWWYRYAQRGATVKAMLAQPWKISYYDDLGVSLKFPHQLLAEESVQADSISASDSTQVVLSAVSRRWAEPNVANVLATRIDYQADFAVDRDKATGQILQSMLVDNGIEGFEFFRNDYSIPNLDARSMAGSYLIGVEAFEFRALMVQQNHTVWYFMVAYPRSKPEGLLIAERFFRGITVDREL